MGCSCSSRVAQQQQFWSRNPAPGSAHAHLAQSYAKVQLSALHCGALGTQPDYLFQNLLLLLSFLQSSLDVCVLCVCFCLVSQLMVVDKLYMYVNLHYRTYRIYHYSSICCAFTTLSSAGSSLSSLSSSESLIRLRLTCILATFCVSLFH